jgi:hypothetical protein
MDTYSRYPTAVPIKAATAKEVARGLFDGWMALFGIMEVLLSDRGSHFINGVISDLLKLLGISKLSTSSYHPQTNGKIERFHRFLMPALMDACECAKHSDWDIQLQKVMFVYRTHDTESTGITPYEAVFGAEPKLPVDLVFGSHAKHCQNYEREHKFNLPLELRRVREKILAHAREYDKERYKRAFRDRYPVHFKPGELVMLHTPAIPIKEDGHTVVRHPTKLLLRWTGPHKVVNQMPNNPNVYKIQLVGDVKPQVVNVARLLKYIPFEATKAPRVLTKAMQLQKEQAQRSAAAVVAPDIAVASMVAEAEAESEILQVTKSGNIFLLKSSQLAALAGTSPKRVSEEKARVEADKKREFKFLLKHLYNLRSKLSMSDDIAEPKHEDLQQLKNRVQDLTEYAAMIAEYNNFYDDKLIIRDYADEIKAYLPSHFVEKHTKDATGETRKILEAKYSAKPASIAAYKSFAEYCDAYQVKNKSSPKPPFAQPERTTFSEADRLLAQSTELLEEDLEKTLNSLPSAFKEREKVPILEYTPVNVGTSRKGRIIRQNRWRIQDAPCGAQYFHINLLFCTCE